MEAIKKAQAAAKGEKNTKEMKLESKKTDKSSSNNVKDKDSGKQKKE